MTLRQRYPEIWAATFGAAWVRFSDAPTPNVKLASICAALADAACQAWHEAEEQRWRDIDAADVAKRGPT